MFSLRGHTISYPSGCYDGGAFELCLPSLGILYQITQLRTQLLGQRCRMIRVWGEGLRPEGTHPPCGPLQRHEELEHYEVLSVSPWIGAGHLRLRLGLLLLLLLELMLEV